MDLHAHSFSRTRTLAPILTNLRTHSFSHILIHTHILALTFILQRSSRSTPMLRRRKTKAFAKLRFHIVFSSSPLPAEGLSTSLKSAKNKKRPHQMKRKKNQG